VFGTTGREQSVALTPQRAARTQRPRGEDLWERRALWLTAPAAPAGATKALVGPPLPPNS